MSKPVKILIVVALLMFTFILSCAGICVSSYIEYANYGNATEKSLEAAVAHNENIYANGTQKVIELAQVPKMYAADVAKVVTAAIQGRYGHNGSGAVFQMLNEKNPSLDPKLYEKITQQIEAFRNEFQVGQQEMIDKRRVYETNLDNVWSGFWLKQAGYPKVDMHKFDIVTTDKAAQAFESHHDTGIDLSK